MIKKAITYSDAITQIEEILTKIDNEELDIDQLAEEVTKVSALIALCRKKLHTTETEVEKILQGIES